MTTIPISGRFQITSDQYQWVVQKCRKRNKQGRLVDEWESVSFYPSFEGALVSLGESMVRNSNAVGYAQAHARLQYVLTTLSRAVSAHLDERP